LGFVYDFIGALVGTWIIFNIFKIILFRFLDRKTVRYVSFVGAFILILIVTTFTMGFVPGFITYIPALFIWFVIDLIKFNKTEKAPLD
jgi:nitrate reductase gamma subunit